MQFILQLNGGSTHRVDYHDDEEDDHLQSTNISLKSSDPVARSSSLFKDMKLLCDAPDTSEDSQYIPIISINASPSGYNIYQALVEKQLIERKQRKFGVNISSWVKSYIRILLEKTMIHEMMDILLISDKLLHDSIERSAYVHITNILEQTVTSSNPSESSARVKDLFFGKNIADRAFFLLAAHNDNERKTASDYILTHKCFKQIPKWSLDALVSTGFIPISDHSTTFDKFKLQIKEVFSKKKMKDMLYRVRIFSAAENALELLNEERDRKMIRLGGSARVFVFIMCATSKDQATCAAYQLSICPDVDIYNVAKFFGPHAYGIYRIEDEHIFESFQSQANTKQMLSHYLMKPIVGMRKGEMSNGSKGSKDDKVQNYKLIYTKDPYSLNYSPTSNMRSSKIKEFIEYFQENTKLTPAEIEKLVEYLEAAFDKPATLENKPQNPGRVMCARQIILYTEDGPLSMTLNLIHVNFPGICEARRESNYTAIHAALACGKEFDMLFCTCFTTGKIAATPNVEGANVLKDVLENRITPLNILKLTKNQLALTVSIGRIAKYVNDKKCVLNMQPLLELQIVPKEGKHNVLCEY